MSEPDVPALTANAVRKVFSDGTVALDDVSIRVERGTVAALIGHNGSGKTTLLKACAGLTSPSSGSISVLGFDPRRSTAGQRARIGYVSQSLQLDPQMTGAETLLLFAALYGYRRGDSRLRVRQVAGEFGIKAHLHKRVSNYSGGLRQRLHLALGLVNEPELWLLDEPTNALDPEGRGLVWQMTRRLAASGGTVVVASHDLASVETQCDSVAMFSRGKLLLNESPRALTSAEPSKPDLATVYFKLSGLDLKRESPAASRGKKNPERGSKRHSSWR